MVLGEIILSGEVDAEVEGGIIEWREVFNSIQFKICLLPSKHWYTMNNTV